MEPCDLTQEVFLHGIEYIVYLKGKEELLQIRIEEKITGNMWKGEFSTKYVEDITQKAGSFKKFPVFVKMMCTALKQENESVYIDILTPQDLENLKTKKAAGNTSTLSIGSQSSLTPSSQPKPKPGGKRYLILTFASEFERVHYPLPLSYDENPEPELLKSTLSRLARELDSLKTRTVVSESGQGTPRSVKSMKSAFGAPVELVEENEILKRRLALLETKRVGGAVDMDCLTKEVIEQESGYDKYLKETDRELSTLRQKLSETEREYNETKDALYKTKSELGHFDKSKSYTEIETLRSELGDISCSLEMERNESRQKIETNKKLLASTMTELGKYIDGEKRLKVRVKQLENELEMALRKANYDPNASRSSSRSSQKGNTPTRYYSPASSVKSNNSSIPKRTNSVPANRNLQNKKQTPTRKPLYPSNNRQPPRSNYRPNYSPASSIRSNSSDKRSNSLTKKPYSPSNRLYSPSGAPRTNNRQHNSKPMGAVDRVSPLRTVNQQRPRVPPAVKNVRQSPGANRNINRSPANRGSVFDRLSGKSPSSRPIKEAVKTNSNQYGKPNTKPPAKPAPVSKPQPVSQNIAPKPEISQKSETKENVKEIIADKKVDEESIFLEFCEYL